MNISLKLLDSDSQINTKILESIRNYLQPAFNKTQQSVQRSIPSHVQAALLNEPEYTSLISGQLRAELGVPDAESRVSQIFAAWSNSVVLQSKPLSIRASRLTGGFSLSLIRSDFSDILALPAATVIDDISGSNIPWLRWLLLDGSKILVRNYTVKLGPNPRSRTGAAVMFETEGTNWRVPSQFAGTINNNWVSRALERLDDSILDNLEKELEKHI